MKTCEALMLDELGGQRRGQRRGQRTFPWPLDLQLSARSPPRDHWPLCTGLRRSTWRQFGLGVTRWLEVSAPNAATW